ncbi:hypothetical protein [Pseudomonas sp. B6002]|uniref:hypothetical protein n=1 Tax=Pseudomonas sp. B6002 TaxID=2726978 RepID=UPI003527538C
MQDKHSHKEVGIVGEAGVTYLLGAKSGAELVARWDDSKSCALEVLPDADVVTNIAAPVRCL